jgi:hypothetical protein
MNEPPKSTEGEAGWTIKLVWKVITTDKSMILYANLHVVLSVAHQQMR